MGAGPATMPSPAAERIGNDIRWFRSSAEQRAAFLQAYLVAGDRLVALSEGRSRGTWAVILDADETVLDNSRYQQERALVDSGYTEASWLRWTARREATALPGAPAFIRDVQTRGGRVAIVTNRTTAECDDTRANLRAVGVEADVVLCKAETSDKNPRFAQVASGTSGLPPLEVLMWIGDNIQDFPGMTQASMRAAQQSAYAEFGRRFVLLPNPMYGSWERNPLP
jgi:5'-nucleotidase (lipoprotein e(P4) family)